MCILRLKPIDPFAHATAQLGDTFYYAIRPEDSVETIITKGKATVTQHILTRLLSSIHSSQHSNSQVPACDRVIFKCLDRVTHLGMMARIPILISVHAFE